MRDIFCAEMIKAFAKKPFVFLTGDLGFKALEPLREAIADHFINVGIAEQNMVSTAAGIAKTGLQVFCYSIAPFAYARPFEQIRNDVCLHNLPVTIVGNGGGYGYGVMGATHHAIEDYGALLCLQNMHVFVPAFDSDVGATISRITDLKKPSYLRLGLAQKSEEIIYSPWRKILDGKMGVLIVAGSIASDLFHDFKNEEPSARPSIWVLCELPLTDFPQNLITEISNKKICVLEEHVAQGGIGTMIAAKILAQNISVKSFSHLHALGYVSGFYGSQNFHREESHLTKKSVINQFQKTA
jgi:transketolase